MVILIVYIYRQVSFHVILTSTFTFLFTLSYLFLFLNFKDYALINMWQQMHPKFGLILILSYLRYYNPKERNEKR